MKTAVCVLGVILLATRAPGQVYCTATSTNCDEFISRVQCGMIDNMSVCAHYANYTAMSNDVFPTGSFTITVTNGRPVYSADQCGIWIDWNQNGSFYDAGEAVAVTGTPGPGPYTAIITVPMTAALGPTRMRIRVAYTGALDPCGTAGFGEVEDYQVLVVAIFAGACCFDETCEWPWDPFACADQGGTYLGDGTGCTPNPCAPPACTGDMNCDRGVTFADIDGFVEALSGESAWTHPSCPWLDADCNHDGGVTFADIDGFVALIGTQCP
jgi:hypothetical protein